MLAKGQANVFFGNENTVYITGHDTPEKILIPDTMIQNTRGLTPAEPVKVEHGSLLEDAKKDSPCLQQQFHLRNGKYQVLCQI